MMLTGLRLTPHESSPQDPHSGATELYFLQEVLSLPPPDTVSGHASKGGFPHHKEISTSDLTFLASQGQQQVPASILVKAAKEQAARTALQERTGSRGFCN